jgi:hypothetical protein
MAFRSGHDEHDPDPEWLKVLLALVSAVLLGLLYVALRPNAGAVMERIQDLLLMAIPSAVVLLLAAPAVYFVLRPSGKYGRARAEAVAETVVDRLPTDVGRLTQVLDFNDTYRDVDWDRWLASAEHSFDIVVYYYDSWTRANFENLRAYFEHKSSKLRIVMADPRVPENMHTVERLFPEYQSATLREKIERTGERLANALAEAGGPFTRLEVYYFPHPLPYSAQCLDGRVLVLSVFEVFRQERIESPAVVIDLQKSSHVAKYWAKEFEGLVSQSERLMIRATRNP